MIRSVMCGVGSALPKKKLSNDEIAKFVETSDSWIVQRTGIHQRYIASENETTVSLGIEAAQVALTNAGMTIKDIDCIILATSTPNRTFPSSAVEIQHALGMSHGFSFDVQAVCSGFIFALTIGDVYLRSGEAKRVLVIGSETFSRILDWKDRTTCVLFGDGAGAAILEAREVEGNVAIDRGILSTKLRSNGAHIDKLYADGGPSTTQTIGYLRMKGQEVFKHAVGIVTDVIDDCFAAVGMNPSQLDWFVPHQANKRIIEASAKKLGIKTDKVVITVDQHGNTSAASVPLALATAVQDGRIKEGDLVLLEAMGGGFTWGAVLIRW
ncbi:3-oxoacyl-[acyl-carrier-protein] synthase 3 [Bartonella bacilliformis Peru38]|uniref:Beta-ketoacyl-[acyl-carrier-protein] synthase III n=2 Tax=Bartonella bacilliformis TaxID=774 RepID=FABH_BARBK|nr:beta-ketoacyl-ACP synthase III [Bartonella bacilliformis]A1USI9.1 RecName: Full=Beta-ketoacyl-[acyl-carrier-protein] synthase III; Short=Beta-ketoacyl-ACP synthase III; Short=KAS III; AltName: Full=3-oxoacyl-[acyl-carrier-protein] synthase 3; AltName: Full=3-oxoacyl-[acyl-carrier-protein] synthase III [Bartonella bacilliformis KC583]ABM45195.1 3-oxoacyl-(acyl-carrier-protein) synthase III [Bartonella bacilliformis KC583]AMG85759.1 3-oxoacyl-ACP synthase III [Bartonella bacilliformis]EKS44545